MPRVHKRKARKDYPENGIKKGDTYYYTKLKLFRGGMVKRSLTPFKRSQLTTSEFLSQVYEIEDSLGAAESVDVLEEIAECLRTLGEEQNEKYGNLPEPLQMGDTGQLLEQRAEACGNAADEIEQAVSDFKGNWESEPTEVTMLIGDGDDYETLEEALEAYHEAEGEALEAAKGVSIDY